MIIRCLYSILLLKTAYTDYTELKIYNRYPCCILLLALIQMCCTSVPSCSERFMAMLIVSIPMFIIAIGLPHSLGGGDIKLMASSGMLLGVEAVLDALCLAVLTAGVYAMIKIALHKMNRNHPFAFGPFLAFGLLTVVWWNGS